MEKATQQQLERRIEVFLDTKLAKFPELRQPIEAKARWNTGGLRRSVGKIVSYIN